MATRANQFEVLAAGVIWNGDLIDTPWVKFLAAGTNDAKTAWEDKDKSVAITQKVLNGQGRANVYGDGIYKLEFYDGDPSEGVKLFEIDNYKCVAVFGDTRTIATSTVGTSDDAFILADTTSNDITYTLPDAALMVGRRIDIKKISGLNVLAVAAPDGQTIDGEASIDSGSGQFASDGENWWAVQPSSLAVGISTTLVTPETHPNVDFTRPFRVWGQLPKDDESSETLTLTINEDETGIYNYKTFTLGETYSGATLSAQSGIVLASGIFENEIVKFNLSIWPATDTGADGNRFISITGTVFDNLSAATSGPDLRMISAKVSKSLSAPITSVDFKGLSSWRDDAVIYAANI